MIKEGEESYTTNLCQKLYNESLKAKGEKNTDKLAVERVREAKSAPWKALENDGKRTIRAGNVGILFAKKEKAKRFREQAEEEKQAGTRGQWQLESPATEYLEQVKSCSDTGLYAKHDEAGFVALKSGDWEEYKKHFEKKEVKVSEWAVDRIREAFEKVAKDEAKKLSIVQEIKIRSTDYMRRILAPAGGQGCVTMSYLCPHCNSFPLEHYVWWVSGGKGRDSWWCAIRGENTTGSNQTGSWWCKQVKVLIRPKVFKSACSTSGPWRKSD